MKDSFLQDRSQQCIFLLIISKRIEWIMVQRHVVLFLCLCMERHWMTHFPLQLFTSIPYTKAASDKCQTWLIGRDYLLQKVTVASKCVAVCRWCLVVEALAEVLETLDGIVECAADPAFVWHRCLWWTQFGTRCFQDTLHCSASVVVFEWEVLRKRHLIPPSRLLKYIAGAKSKPN